MSIRFTTKHEIGVSLILACFNVLVALAQVCLSLFLAIAVCMLARFATATIPAGAVVKVRGSEKSPDELYSAVRFEMLTFL